MTSHSREFLPIERRCKRMERKTFQTTKGPRHSRKKMVTYGAQMTETARMHGTRLANVAIGLQLLRVAVCLLLLRGAQPRLKS